MEEMGVQNNDEGPHEQKKPHSANYTTMEDVMVTMAYFKALEDLICGAKQKGHSFRSKIEFISIEKSNPIASGEELKVWKRHLHDIYKAKYLSEFKSNSC